MKGKFYGEFTLGHEDGFPGQMFTFPFLDPSSYLTILICWLSLGPEHVQRRGEVASS